MLTTSYSLSVQSQEEQSRNWEEFGPKRTREMPSSGPSLSLNSVLEERLPPWRSPDMVDKLAVTGRDEGDGAAGRQQQQQQQQLAFQCFSVSLFEPAGG